MVLNLKVKIIPDMSQFNRDLKRGVIGVGNGRTPKDTGKGIVGDIQNQLKNINKSIIRTSSETQLKELVKRRDVLKDELSKKLTGKKDELKVAGFGKLLGFVAISAGILKGLEFFIKPILQLLNAVLALLFLPLVPILKPVLIGLGKFVKKFAEFQRKSKEGWELFLSGNAWDVLKNTIVNGLGALKDKILDGLVTLGQKIINGFINAVNRIPFVNIPNVGGGRGGTSTFVPPPSGTGFNMSTPSGPEFAPPPVNISFPNMSVASTHDANNVADRVLSIFKSGLTRTLPLLR